MTISQDGLNRWKTSSIRLALKLDFDKNILEFINRNTTLKLIPNLPPEGMWYGWCKYDPKHPIIEVYHRNLSTEDISVAMDALRNKGLSDKLIEEIVKIYNRIGKPNFFEIYNQSGMDHELIGHLYNHIAGKSHDERAAVQTQILFAEARKEVKAGKRDKHSRNS